jgi:hypothetical protein
MKILFNYTTRTRPDWFERGLRSIVDNVESDNYIVLVSIDLDDDSMREMVKKYMTNDKIRFIYGTSTGKVNAINRDVDLFDEWDILVNMSDDMIFTQKGFDTIIRNSFDNLDQCIHFPDTIHFDKLITLSVLGRDYYDRFGYVYHPEYISVWCDNETTEVARLLGCYKFVNCWIYEHLHPATGKISMDAQYHYTESFAGHDESIFQKRQQQKFDLN